MLPQVSVFDCDITILQLTPVLLHIEGRQRVSIYNGKKILFDIEMNSTNLATAAIAAKLEKVKMYLLEDMKRRNVPAKIQNELDAVMKFVIQEVKAGRALDANGNLIIEIQNKDLQKLINKVLVDLMNDVVEQDLKKHIGKKMVGQAYVYPYNAQWYNYWWYSYYYRWQPYFYWYNYPVTYVGKKAGQAMNDSVYNLVESAKNMCLECDNNGMCTLSMKFTLN